MLLVVVGVCQGSTAISSIGSMKGSGDSTLDGVAEGSAEGWKILKVSVELTTVSDDSVPDATGTPVGKFEGCGLFIVGTKLCLSPRL